MEDFIGYLQKGCTTVLHIAKFSLEVGMTAK